MRNKFQSTAERPCPSSAFGVQLETRVFLNRLKALLFHALNPRQQLR